MESDEMVILHGREHGHLARILDLSDAGTCIYLMDPEAPVGDVGGVTLLSLVHEGQAFEVVARVVRKSGRLLGIEFLDPPGEVKSCLQAKLIRMEGAWMGTGSVH